MSVLKIRDENGNWVGIPTIHGEKGEPGDSVPHAHRHAKGGADEITPGSIGASTAEHTHTLEELGAASLNAVNAANAIANSAATAAEEAKTAANQAKSIANSKAPAYSYGVVDLEAGTSALETGKLHFVYE